MSPVRRHAKHLPRAAYICDPTASLAPSVDIDYSASVTIGPNVIITDDVKILTHDHEPRTGRIVVSPLVIEEGVFIGTRTLVLNGCRRMGHGAYIGAGSVVTHDIPPDELWAGNPARRIRAI